VLPNSRELATATDDDYESVTEHEVELLDVHPSESIEAAPASLSPVAMELDDVVIALTTQRSRRSPRPSLAYILTVGLVSMFFGASATLYVTGREPPAVAGGAIVAAAAAPPPAAPSPEPVLAPSPAVNRVTFAEDDALVVAVPVTSLPVAVPTVRPQKRAVAAVPPAPASPAQAEASVDEVAPAPAAAEATTDER
jgi:hypothetical protein